MEQWRPARVGDSIFDVDTPALVVDHDVLERNLSRMANYARARGVRLRPHGKSHKCATLGRRQMALGAVGLCAQKLGEAEAFVLGGVTDVLITNQVVAQPKLRRLAALMGEVPAARLGVLVDDADNVRALGAAMSAAGVTLDVFLERDVGQRRAGVATTEAVVELGRLVASTPGLRLAGLHAYLGAAQHVRGAAARREAAVGAVAMARAARDGLIAAGLPCEVVTGAGTGTFPVETASGLYNEIQPGSYALMDVDYAKNEPEPDPAVPRFESALFLWSSVTSRTADRVTLDVGLKAQAVECGPAQPTGALGESFAVRSVNDEHTILDRRADGAAPRVGDRVRLVPGHVDPTVNLHEWLVVVEGERVLDLWPIEGRGRFD